MTGPPSRGAVVLAGGASRRMGRDKAWLERDGVPLLAHVVAALRGVAPAVVVVGAPGRALPPLPADVDLVEDPPAHAGAGPLPAVALGLAHLAARGVDQAYLAAVDSPRLAAAHVQAVLEALDGAAAVDAAVPRTADGRSHPLAACVRVGPVGARASALVAAGERRLQALFAPPLAIRWLEGAALPDPDSLAPCNTPEEWARLR